jgi:hydroxyacylglutathione hydrolase
MASERLTLQQAQLGPMANFVYFIGDTVTRKAAVVDPAWDVDAIINFANKEGYEIDKLLITHYHPDHLGGSMMGQNIQGAADMLGKIKAKVYVNKAEAEGTKKVAGLSDSDIVMVDAGDVFNIGEIPVKFLHTPGHTPGSQCFLVEGNLISGDTLFVNSCGRVDLPGSDPAAMYHSLNHTLKNLDDDTVVYPGHAYSSESSTTIAKQKRHNM